MADSLPDRDAGLTLAGNWSYPTAVRFGAGRIAELADACRMAGMSKPLLVTDRGVAQLPIMTRALEELKRGGLAAAVFGEADANPTDQNLAAGIAAYHAGGHDGVVAFGGGSGLDLGKLVAFQQGQTRPVWDFEDIDDWWTRADSAAIAPIVAVPTTAGTGSEMGRAGVLLETQAQVKKIIFHPKILPTAVICDPELTLGMPPFFTAGTGMDAFIHCLEAYSSPLFHPLSQGIALEGLRLALTYLPRAYVDGGDLAARAQMMAAAAMGAVAFQKGLGATHSVSHAVGALFGTHHGMTNAVVLPAVLRLNRPAIEARIEAAAAYLGIAGGFDGFYRHVQELRRRLAVPDRLCELGPEVPETAADAPMETLIKLALEDPSTAGNPVVLSEDNVRDLLLAVI